jgi:hypothetical protein
MASVVAHELEESATDPHVNAGYDSNGEENADKCAWTFGSTYTAASGASANMKLGGLDYLIQQNWVNASGGYCALSYTATPDFSTSVSPSSQSVSPGGITANYGLTATAMNGFSGTVNWTISPPGGITSSSASRSGNHVTFTLTAGATLGAGTYTIPISATSSSLIHSTSATLVVSAPSFSLSITPSSQAVRRPSTGTTSATYTVTVTPVGAFSSPVTLSVSGATTGISPVLTPTSNPGTFVLTVTVSNNSKKGGGTLTVTATGGGVTKQATATIEVH